MKMFKSKLLIAAVVFGMLGSVPAIAEEPETSFDANASFAEIFPPDAGIAWCRGRAPQVTQGGDPGFSNGVFNRCINALQGRYDVAKLIWPLLTPERKKQIVIWSARLSKALPFTFYEKLASRLSKLIEDQDNEHEREFRE
jgi:hypothetical protein